MIVTSPQLRDERPRLFYENVTRTYLKNDQLYDYILGDT